MIWRVSARIKVLGHIPLLPTLKRVSIRPFAQEVGEPYRDQQDNSDKREQVQRG